MTGHDHPDEAIGPRSRRVAKRLLRPLLPERVYGPLHSAAKAVDIRTGRWLEPEVALLSALVLPGETAVDIGANQGLYTFHLSRAVGPAGRIHAFEPVPVTYAGLRRVVRLLGLSNVQLAQAALGDSSGEVEFVLPLQPSGAPNTGLAHVAGVEGGAGEAVRVRGRIMRLDDFPVRRHVSLIKCDVEGGELLALRGAERLISRDGPSLLLEVDERYMARYGLAPADLLDHLVVRGYRPYRLRDDGPGLVAVDGLGAGNYLFVHGRRYGRVRHLVVDPGVPTPR